MEAMTSGIVPTLDYSRGYNNYGYGCNDGFGSWWILIILFALWGHLRHDRLSAHRHPFV